MIWDNDKRLRSTTKIYRDDFVIMNTDNKIHLSHGRRDLQKQLSSGVHDLNNPEHFPAFPGSPVHGAGERGLNHLRTSFKQVVESKLEAQSPSVNVEAPDGLFTASPRIGARRQPEAAEQPEQSIQANPQQASSVTDTDGFQYLKQRRTRSPKSTKEENTTSVANSQDPFGIPGHTNLFAVLADEPASPLAGEPASPMAGEPAHTCEEHPQFREGFFSRGIKGAAKLAGRWCGRLVKENPKTTALVAMVAVSAVKLLLLRRTSLR